MISAKWTTNKIWTEFVESIFKTIKITLHLCLPRMIVVWTWKMSVNEFDVRKAGCSSETVKVSMNKDQDDRFHWPRRRIKRKNIPFIFCQGKQHLIHLKKPKAPQKYICRMQLERGFFFALLRRKTMLQSTNVERHSYWHEVWKGGWKVSIFHTGNTQSDKMMSNMKAVMFH